MGDCGKTISTLRAFCKKLMQETGYLPEDTTAYVSGDLLVDLGPEDQRTVIELIERLEKK